MKKTNKRVIPKIYILAGTVLLLIGALIFCSWQISIHLWMQKSQAYIEDLYALMPAPQGAVLEERMDNSMPVLSINETDFIGILEMPAFDHALPVCANWGRITKYPCAFSGSIYDGSIKVGATSQKGQFDFYREICVGDTVIFTDTEGNRYTYSITNLKYEKHADQTTLNKKEADLTIFIKNVFDFEYLIVSCNVLN